MMDHQKTGGGVEFAGLENDGVEQEQTYILHTMKSFNVYDMSCTVRHVSQCCSLRYSFSFSHKCPGLVGSSSRLQS